ncbi:MAG: type II CAAX endopeptidase family protein [Actinomycetota bacterium]
MQEPAPKPTLGARVLMSPVVRLVIAILVLITVATPLLLSPPLRSGLLSFYGIQVVAGLAALYVVGRFIEMRSPAQFGLGAKGAGKELAIGFAIGAVIMSFVVGIFAAAGWYQITGFGSTIGPKGLILTGTGPRFVELVLFFLLVGVFEEILFRGLLLRIFQDGVGSWAALAISSLAFGLVHANNPNADIWSALAIALEAGLLLGGAFILTRSIWMPIGIHWAWNLFQGPVFGASVSGGSFGALFRSKTVGPELLTGGGFGPEGGLVALTVATGAGIALLILAARRGRFLTAKESKRLHLEPDL